jgi:hypothetical protein
VRKDRATVRINLLGAEYILDQYVGVVPYGGAYQLHPQDA